MRMLLQQIADGFRDKPMTAPDALRAGIRWLVAVACVLLLRSLTLLIAIEAGFGVGPGLVAIEALSTLLIFMAGLQVSRGLKPHGHCIMACAGLYIFAGLTPHLVRADNPLESCFRVVLFGGPIIELVTFALLAGAVWKIAAPDRPAHIAWAIAAVFPVALVLSLPAIFGHEGEIIGAWLLAPPAAAALACFLAYRHMRIPRAELELAQLMERPEFDEFYLIEHTFPAGVATSIVLPFTPFERAEGGGTPLGNPVLDELLPIYTKEPMQLAEILAGNEATVLAVLHAWPNATLHNNTLSWEASMAQIQERGPNIGVAIVRVQNELSSFQRLFGVPFQEVQ
ncbi:MAG: hypothetical protein ACI9VR_003602 [Cognaticolwellia sp.]|jgi:hypothetical protein